MGGAERRGDSRTVMITCLSPCEADFAENLNSLKYATRVSSLLASPWGMGLGGKNPWGEWRGEATRAPS